MKRQANQSSRICYSIPLVLALRNINPDGQASRGNPPLDTLSSVTACLLLQRNGQSAGTQLQPGAS